MKSIRRLIIVLVSIAIPLNSWAAMPAPTTPCPMMQAAAHADELMSADTGLDFAEMTMDCCEDSDNPTGKCKPGQSCSPVGVFVVLGFALNVFPPHATDVRPQYAPPHVSAPSAAIWHPPQILTI